MSGFSGVLLKIASDGRIFGLSPGFSALLVFLQPALNSALVWRVELSHLAVLPGKRYAGWQSRSAS